MDDRVTHTIGGNPDDPRVQEERELIISDEPEDDDGTVRTFGTGATRDSAEDKLDYEGFLCPRVLQRFAQYMHKHRYQSDGTLRDSDNWQKGIPLDAYMKSLWRHFMELWATHRGVAVVRPEEEDYQPDLEDVLCAILFNVQGYLHEHLKEKEIERDETGKPTHRYGADMRESKPVWPDDHDLPG